MRKQDLLLAGWHSVTENGKEYWHHPDMRFGVVLPDAKKIQSLFDKGFKFEHQSWKQEGLTNERDC